MALTHSAPELYAYVIQSVGWKLMMLKQATQDFVAGLHWGLEMSLQSVLPRHPTQALIEVSQTGLVGSLQSVLATHSTQVFVTFLHAVLLVEYVQSVEARHSTQVLSVAHTAFDAVQWSSVMHSTQTFNSAPASPASSASLVLH